MALWRANLPLFQCNPECTPTSAYLQSMKYEKGTETFSTTIECAISEILKSPLTMKKVIEEARRAFDRKKWMDDTGVQKRDLIDTFMCLIDRNIYVSKLCSIIHFY